MGGQTGHGRDERWELLPWPFLGPGHTDCGRTDTNPREPAVAVAQGMAHRPHARPLVVLGHQALQPSTARSCPWSLCPGII